MAHRRYLFTTDHLPGSAEWTEKKALRGICEWPDAIPLSFQILLSGNPVAVQSSNWVSTELLALAGDSETGFRRLMAFLLQVIGSNSIAYYFIERKKDNKYFNGNEIAKGPFTESHFLEIKSELGLPEFTKEF